jgi:hypothetical protein
MYDCTLSVSKNCMEYRYNLPITIHVSFQILDQNDVIQIGMNNQEFNAEQIKRINIYPESKNHLKINSERMS